MTELKEDYNGVITIKILYSSLFARQRRQLRHTSKRNGDYEEFIRRIFLYYDEFVLENQDKTSYCFHDEDSQIILFYKSKAYDKQTTLKNTCKTLAAIMISHEFENQCFQSS